MYTETTTTKTVFPFVSFTNLDGKEFDIHRDRILHYETYCTKDENGNEVLDASKTFVNFLSPNPKSKGALHAIVAMPVAHFRDAVMRPAYGDCDLL